MFQLSRSSGRCLTLCFSRIQHLSKTIATHNPQLEDNCIRENVHLNNGTEEKNKIVPKVMDQWNVVKLSCESVAEGGLCDVYLVGTRHYSKVVFLEFTLKDLDGRFTHEPMLSEITSVTPTPSSVTEILTMFGFPAAVSAIITGALITGILYLKQEINHFQRD